MTFEEFNKQMEIYEGYLNPFTDFSTWSHFVTKLQKDYIGTILDTYKADTEAKKVIRNLIGDARYETTSGNAIEWVPTEELANEIKAIIEAEIGKYLLDYQIYEDGDEWAIDVTFAGRYVTHWDGYFEELKEKKLSLIK